MSYRNLLQFNWIQLSHPVELQKSALDISADYSKVKIFVIPTDEEKVFIEDVVALYEESRSDQTKYIYRFQVPSYQNLLRHESFEKECREDPELRKIVAEIPVRSFSRSG